MPTYQEFVRKAKERFEARQKRKASGTGQYVFTAHSEYKMKQYGLSEQRVKSVIRNPKRREEGIVKDTVAVMQPTSVKRGQNGQETWKQEIWVMYRLVNPKPEIRNPKQIRNSNFEAHQLMKLQAKKLRVISAWRYPGVSPKRNPIPEEILRELMDGSIMETGE